MLRNGMNKRAIIPQATEWDLRRLRERSELRPCPVDGLGDCRVWTGATHCGYGAMGVKGRVFYTHRLVATWLKGMDLSDHRTVARHRCNVRSCINEDHIVVGTHADNARDREASERHYVSACDPNQPG